jgi:hypothetical protein
VAALRTNHALAVVFRGYAAGVRYFDRERLEQALGRPLDSRAGASRLAAAGLGMVRMVGRLVELRATDPRTARLVNRSRLGPQLRGYRVHKVLEALLCLAPKAKRRRAVTEDRRLQAALLLADERLIDADDLLECRPFIRLRSRWFLPGAPAGR